MDRIDLIISAVNTVIASINSPTYTDMASACLFVKKHIYFFTNTTIVAPRPPIIATQTIMSNPQQTIIEAVAFGIISPN